MSLQVAHSRPAYAVACPQLAKADIRALTRDSGFDPGCVKTLRGIIAPGILGPMVMRRAKKRKNLSSARHYDQIRFRFYTTKTHLRHWLCTAASVLISVSAPINVLA